jgi:hypothetical protein
MKVQLLFAWYDLWIGFFWDSKKRWLYILPVPMFGLILKFEKKPVPDQWEDQRSAMYEAWKRKQPNE